jgi:riboflavin kinase/FMN adenylyltransferase
MQILTDLSQVKPEPSCLTIGYFDGVHRGHRYLINQASAAARRQGLRAVLLTFYPHPSVVLRGAEPFYLSTREEKLALLVELDLDLIIIQPFTPGLAQTRASQFVDWLVERIGMVNLWVGPDFALGYRREGDIPFLQRMGDERGFAVNVVERLKLDGNAVSSSRIRRALRAGDVALAARYLGRPYSLQGPVIVGAQRGRTIGFPTANVEVPAERAVPANGVYAAWARLHPVRRSALPDRVRDLHLTPQAPPQGGVARQDKWAAGAEASSQGFVSTIPEAQLEGAGEERRRAVVNIGTRPTFANGPRTIEAHLLDFDHDIYGQRLTLDFVTHLRPERRFNGVEELVTQINRDVERARQLLHVTE